MPNRLAQFSLRFVWIVFFAMRMLGDESRVDDARAMLIDLVSVCMRRRSHMRAPPAIDMATIDGATRTALHRRQPDRMESVCTPSRRPRPALRRTGAEASLRAGAQSKPRRSSSDRVTAAGGGWRARVCAMDRAGVQRAPVMRSCRTTSVIQAAMTCDALTDLLLSYNHIYLSYRFRPDGLRRRGTQLAIASLRIGTNAGLADSSLALAAALR
ncbi:MULTISPECIES: hypothetical protein [Lysobacter]|uniref:hypothetical protein n=2 Tax=Lysobacteraceae TaxID=32033 RepID=UPI001F180948|nr:MULTISPECIES: hypothetical protein [Lysobacter]UJB18253.1 hypothetical protein L1A79_18185 [Lysobacter capsici]UJQ28024.1 hypothetical protein L2D09_21700 [Lysobacter gummosus]